MSNILNHDDFVGAGFKKMDPKVLDPRPPKINWGRLYKNKTEEQKVKWLEKFACSMNDAADRLQNERDELARLCEKKEAQIETLAKAMRQNMAMLQSEVARMNADKQEWLREAAKLKSRIRELEKQAEAGE